MGRIHQDGVDRGDDRPHALIRPSSFAYAYDAGIVRAHAY